ncbi:SDR family NAD(P)-dependent oxidoreductase [Kribbella ginsengisoli]|uniref:SDR family NAD(P)-dependent oxidoreductase n=1 Tax=Kribbella ginsengisoli TaxID=363865 RepID=UPI0031E0BCAD
MVTGELAEIRRELDTHFWGTLDVIRVFSPILAANGGGAVVNVLSALSWFAAPGAGAYAVAKAAEWNMTNAVRLELADQGTLVQGVHLGAADTDMMAGYDGPKVDPREVTRRALDGLSAGSIEVVVDDWTAMVKSSLAGDPALFYQQLA